VNTKAAGRTVLWAERQTRKGRASAGGALLAVLRRPSVAVEHLVLWRRDALICGHPAAHSA